MVDKISDNLDYNLETAEERLDFVNKLVEEYDEYLTDFYSDNYNPHLNQTGFLSENTKVGKDLETIASYLLYSKDSEANDDTITDYKKKRNSMREASIENILKVRSTKKDSKKVSLTSNKIKVNKQDRKDHEELMISGEIIKNLTKMIKTRKTSTGETISEKEVRRLKWIRTDIQKDEIAVKNELKGYIRFQSITKQEKDMQALSYIRYDDVETIRVLIENYEELKTQSTNDTHGYLKIVLFDLERLIEETDFEDYMKEILVQKIQRVQYDEIMKILEEEYDMKTSSKRLSEITRKTIPTMIVETYKQIREDWVYTHVFKGEYKTCTSCKTNYLANTKYFSPDNNTKTGLKPICKSCRNKKYVKKNKQAKKG